MIHKTHKYAAFSNISNMVQELLATKLLTAFERNKQRNTSISVQFHQQILFLIISNSMNY